MKLHNLPALLTVLSSILALSGLSTPAAQAAIRAVEPQFMQTTDFQCIPEFFTGQESAGNRFVYRTDTARREGLYLKVFLDKAMGNLPQGSSLQVDFMTSSSKWEHTINVPLNRQKPGARTILVGLTSPDFLDTPAEKTQLPAWRVSLLDTKGQVVDQKQSFLWALPDKASE